MQHADIAPGTLLAGRYRVVRLVGVGGMGGVYEAVQEDLGRRVAVKVLHPALLFDRDAVTRFEREARAAAELGHPNIVQVTDFQWHGGTPILVMEYLVGRSLGEVLRAEKQIPSPRACFIATQVLLGLEAAHRAGIVHRDIKPDNVFLVSMSGMDDLVKVLDFGVAKLAAKPEGNPGLTARGTMLGSPSFLAPEQARGADVDLRADLYAVAVLLYFLLSGRLPFEAPELHQLVYAIVEGSPQPLRTFVAVDPRIEAIIHRGMSKDPAQRFQSATEMRDLLLPLSVASGAASFTGPAMAPGAPHVAAAASPPAPPMAHHPSIGTGPTQFAPPPVAPRSSAALWAIFAVLLVILLLIGAGIGAFFLFMPRASTTVATSTPSGTPVPSSPTGSTTAPAPSSSIGGALVVASASTSAPTATVKPPPTPSGGKAGPQPSATAPPSAAPSGQKAKASGGTTVSFSGGSCGDRECSRISSLVASKGPMLNQCYAKNQFDGVDHQFLYFTLAITKDGVVTRIGPTTSSTCPIVGACVMPILRSINFGPADLVDGRMKFNGEAQIGLTSRAPENP